MSERVDWFLFIDYTRRVDFAVMYLCKHIIYVILSYSILFPKGISRGTKVFVFTLSLFDLIHYFLTSHIGFSLIKLLLCVFVFVVYKKNK